MLLLILLIGVGNFFLAAYVFMCLWNWLPSEILGTPSIGYAASLGLMIFISFIRGMYANASDDKKMTYEECVATNIAQSIYLGIALVIGYVVSLFV